MSLAVKQHQPCAHNTYPTIFQIFHQEKRENHHETSKNSSVRRIRPPASSYSAGHYQRGIYLCVCLVLLPGNVRAFLSNPADKDSRGEIPDPAVIKQYRIDHPGTSIQDAMTALMTKPNDKA